MAVLCSTFGFADDHYAEQVRRHPAPDGVRIADALRHGLGELAAVQSLVSDLSTLAPVLRAAHEPGVAFALVLRLHE